jgi:hypothetical protein
VFNANTLSSTLVPQTVADTVIITADVILAPFASMMRNFSTDPLRPRASVAVPKPTAVPAVVTNATNFETGDSTLAAVSITVNQYTQTFGLANADIQQGFMVEQLSAYAARNLAIKLWQLAAANITAANFAASATITAANFDATKLADLYTLTKVQMPSLILDRGHYAKLLPYLNTQLAPGTNFFARTYEATDWTAAAANCRGFVFGPEAIVLAAGLPATPDVIGSSLFSQDVITLPNVGLSIQQNIWASLASRSIWVSFDVLFGTAVGDGSAGGRLMIA